MELGNIIKAATFKSFLHTSYKNTQLLIFVIVPFNIFMRQTLTNYFGRLTQKYELRVSFKYFFSKCHQIPRITFIEEILSRKLHFFVYCLSSFIHFYSLAKNYLKLSVLEFTKLCHKILKMYL